MIASKIACTSALLVVACLRLQERVTRAEAVGVAAAAVEAEEEVVVVVITRWEVGCCCWSKSLLSSRAASVGRLRSGPPSTWA